MKFLNFRKQGATLVDILIASILLGLLTAILFSLLKSGTVALRKVENQSELLRELQLLSLKISQEAQESNFASLSVSADETMVAFLSAKDSNGVFQADNFGRPLWQKFVVYYHDVSDNTIRRTEVPHSSTSPLNAVTLEVSSGGAITDFSGFGNPTTLAHNVTSCKWKAISPGLLNFEFHAEKKRFQAEGMEQKSFSSTVRLRN